jgi:hypothetical protein
VIISEIEQLLLDNGYDSLSPYDMNRVIVHVAGAMGKSSNYNDITLEDVFNYHKELKISIFKQLCEESILEGFTSSNGHFYRTNRDDQINLMGQRDELVFDETIDKVMWKTEDVGYVEHTRDEWLMVYSEAFAHKKKQLFKYNTLKGELESAIDDKELVAIKWQ